MPPAHPRGPGRSPPNFEIKGDKTGSGPPILPGRYKDEYYDGMPYAGPIPASRAPKDGNPFGFLGIRKRKKRETSYISPSESIRVKELEAELAEFRAQAEKPPARLPAPSKRKMKLD